MKFILIELKGFKFLALNHINHIVITPKNKFHWILGTNGSGKSSLQREISVLPANPAHYRGDGFKRVIVEYKGSIYELTSDFSGPKRKFSFIKDGEELNLGHTSTIFANLAFQHFGMTKEIHEFALGLKKFSGMSPSDRKNWITKLSDADYTFALGYFLRLTKAWRDTVGSINTDQNRLMEAKAKMVSKEQIEGLEDDLKLLREKASFLMEVMPNPRQSWKETQDHLKSVSGRLQQLYQHHRSNLRLNKRYLPLLKEEDNLYEISMAESRLLGEEQKAEAFFQELEKISHELDVHAQLQNVNQSTLESDLIKRHSRLEELKRQPLYRYAPDAHIAKEQFQEWVSALDLVVPTLVPDVEGDFNEENHQVNVQQLNKTRHELDHWKLQKSSAFRFLEEARSCDHQVATQICPACNHSWIPGKTEADIKKWESQFNLSEANEKQTWEKYQVLEEEVQKYQRFKQGLDYLNNLVWKYDLFKPFWEQVFSERLHLTHPDSIQTKAYQYQTALDGMIEMDMLANEIVDIQAKIEMLKNSAVHSEQFLQNRKHFLEKEIDKVYQGRQAMVDQLNWWKGKQAFRKSLEKMEAERVQLTKLWTELSKTDFDHNARSRLGDMLLEANSQIVQIERSIRAAEVQKGQITMLEENLEATMAFSKVLKAAVDELSPSKGLIAKGLTGFINHLTGLVNGIIEKVWLHPMQLIPVLPDEEDKIELDYRFRVKVKDEEVPEISECSTGQKEIIDLGFKVVGLIFLKMDHGPLFLDEFGANMDLAHKASAFNMISKLLATSNFSQIFMISHFENTYNQGLEADITVLCSANIQIPQGVEYNVQTQIA